MVWALVLAFGLWPLASRAGDPWRCGHEHVSRAWGEQCKQVTELAAATLWDLGLDLLGLDQGLDSLSTCTHGLGVACLHLLQALLVVLLGKAHVPQEPRVYPLERFISLQSGCLEAAAPFYIPTSSI